MTGDAKNELRAAWDDLIDSMQRARDAIDQPELMPAPDNPRNLAEARIMNARCPNIRKVARKVAA